MPKLRVRGRVVETQTHEIDVPEDLWAALQGDPRTAAREDYFDALETLGEMIFGVEGEIVDVVAEAVDVESWKLCKPEG